MENAQAVNTEARWTETALADLPAIHDYFAEERPAALPLLMRAFPAAMEQIELFPESGPFTLRLRDGRTYRSILAGNYRIYYRVSEDVVLVVRVWDARRNPRSLELED